MDDMVFTSHVWLLSVWNEAITTESLNIKLYSPLIKVDLMLKRPRRDGKNTQKNCIKGILMNQITTMPEPDILECEINWALMLIKLVDAMKFQQNYSNP